MATVIVHVVSEEGLEMKKGWIYLLGIAVLGLGYGTLKTALGTVPFVVVALGYLVMLRALVERYGR